MKKLIMVAVILAASFNSYSQEPAVAYPPKEDIAAMNAKQKPKIDSSDIPLISIKDLELTLAELGDKISHNNFVLIQQAFQQVLTDAIKRKQAKPKK